MRAPTVPAFAVVVPGEPEPHRRPRIGRRKDGRPVAITAPEDRSYAGRVMDAWVEAGRPRLPAGPYRVEVTVVHRRPRSHFLSDGVTLSAAGRRAPYPTRGDWDSYARWLDPLVRVGAVPDDRHVYRGVVDVRWADVVEDDGGGWLVEDACLAMLVWSDGGDW